jgi:glutamate N-acetyltransferase/amino-acid N-acetyltransferase
MVLVLANGVSGVKLKDVNQGSLEERFTFSLKALFEQNARKILEDGEGARHVVSYRIRGLEDSSQAKRLGEFLCDSLLVRCALAGEDPNFAGRLLARIGAFIEKLPMDSLRVFLDGVPVYAKGELFPQKRPNKVKEILNKPFYEVHVDFGGVSNEDVVCMGCDLTLEYVRFNSAYTT